jgi:hypothetical protein
MRGGKGKEASGPAGSWANRPKARKRGEKKILLFFFYNTFSNSFSKGF